MVSPKVSVVMITYNHEEYIADAINGVLNQICDFSIELIIANDCSQDKTDEVVRAFSNHPNYHWIKYTRHTKNKGMMANFVWALNQASGNYIALCEGDDYWTDWKKLKRQINFLDENREYSGVFHNVEQRWNTVDRSELYLKHGDYSLTKSIKISDIIGHNIVPTCSLVCRFDVIQHWLDKLPWLKFNYADWIIVLLLAREKPLYYQPSISATRLMNENSVWGMRSDLFQINKTIETRRIIHSLGLIPTECLEEFNAYNQKLLIKKYQIKNIEIIYFFKRILRRIIRILDQINYFFKKVKLACGRHQKH